MFWSWSKVDVFNPFVYTDEHPVPYVYKDHSLVEVTRFAQRTGYVGSDGAGYGLWFWVLPGSGVAVNIGKAIRFSNKNDAIVWSQRVAKKSELACATTGMQSCTVAADTYFCAAARIEGYDSVISWRDRTYYGSPHVSGVRSDIVELILCPVEEPPEQTTACPSMITFYRTAGGRCTCHNNSEILTCLESGDEGRVAMAADYGTRIVSVVSVGVAIYVLPAATGVAFAVLATIHFWRRRSKLGAATGNAAANTNMEGWKLSPSQTPASAKGEPSMPLLVVSG